ELFLYPSEIEQILYQVLMLSAQGRFFDFECSSEIGLGEVEFAFLLEQDAEIGKRCRQLVVTGAPGFLDDRDGAIEGLLRFFKAVLLFVDLGEIGETGRQRDIGGSPGMLRRF